MNPRLSRDTESAGKNCQIGDIVTQHRRSERDMRHNFSRVKPVCIRVAWLIVETDSAIAQTQCMASEDLQKKNARESGRSSDGLLPIGLAVELTRGS